MSQRRQWLLAWLLRLCGIIDVLALFVAVMPKAWIASIHAQLDMGLFPEDVLTHYLARSTSLMYGFHGAILLYVSFDVIRYLRLIRWMAVLAIVHGVLIFAIDWHTGMPVWWMLGESGLLVVWGATILILGSQNQHG